MIGRFISIDPVKDGFNWYVYCNNNPLKLSDPTGLKDVKITLIYEISTHSMNFDQFKEWSSYKEDRLNQISDQEKRNTYGGIGVGTLISLGSLSLSGSYAVLGVLAGGGVTALSTAEGFELNETMENIKDVHDKLYPSFIGEKDDMANFTLHKETISELVKRRDTSTNYANNSYFIEFIDGRIQIDRETYDFLFNNTELTNWHWSSKTEEK